MSFLRDCNKQMDDEIIMDIIMDKAARSSREEAKKVLTDTDDKIRRFLSEMDSRICFKNILIKLKSYIVDNRIRTRKIEVYLAESGCDVYAIFGYKDKIFIETPLAKIAMRSFNLHDERDVWRRISVRFLQLLRVAIRDGDGVELSIGESETAYEDYCKNRGEENVPRARILPHLTLTF